MRSLGWKFWLGAVWVLFNLSLAGWWLKFGLRQAEIIHSVNHPEGSPNYSEKMIEIAGQSRMLLSEGVILMLSMLLGGLFLLYYIIQERRQGEQIRSFFAAFSHELKTSIASHRLQVESIIEDAPAGVSRKALDRLSRDSVKLELQLENSLVVSQLESSQFFIEDVPLEKILLTVSQQWPELSLRAAQTPVLKGDRRVFETVFKNLAQNALLHGNANELSFETKKVEGKLHILVKNDGTPFVGSPKNLGKLFHRHNSRSGSGVGLFLVQSLIRKQGGEVHFSFDAENRLQIGLVVAEGKA